MYKEPRLKSNVYVITYKCMVGKYPVIEKEGDGFIVSYGDESVKYYYSDYKKTWFSSLPDVRAKYLITKKTNGMYIEPKRNYFNGGF